MPHDNIPDEVWLLQDLDTGAELVFTAEHLAIHAAERIVGNRSAATFADGYLYGPGDGTTRVMVRKLPRDIVIKMDLHIPIE